MTPLKPFQRIGCRQIYHWNGRALLADEMGLGKTIQALYWVLKTPKHRPAVIVCPASLKYTWQAEAAQHFHLRVEVIEGRHRLRQRRLPGDIVIINYDILKSWLPLLLAADPQIVIFDECFPYQTNVLTAFGLIPIGELVEQGIQVPILSMAKDGSLIWKSIVRFIKLPRRENLVRIHHSNGDLVCTENHYIWTETRGYVKAKELQGGEVLRMVRGDLTHSQNPFLLSRPQQQMGSQISPQLYLAEHESRKAPRDWQENISCQNGSSKSGIVLLDEITQSFPQSQIFDKGSSNQSPQRDPSCVEWGSWWEWPYHQTAETFIQSFRVGLEIGTGDPYRDAISQKRMFAKLQSGHRPPSEENRHRSRWSWSLPSDSEKIRCQKNEIARVIRVESLSLPKSGGFDKSNPNSSHCPYVYCLEVEDTHNFVADGIVVSNCHYLQNPQTGWTKAAFKLAFGASSVLGLSGTPITKRPAGFWPILNMIRPDLFPDRGRFLWRYTAPRWTPWGFRFDGAVRKKELANLLREQCMIRRLKKDILHELPAKIHRFVPFKLNSYKEYNEANDNFLAWLRKKDPLRANRASRNEAQARVGYLLRLAVQLKMQWTVQWLQEFAEAHPGKKVVGLTMHTAVINHLHQTFPNSVVVDGNVTGRKRVESVRRFQTDPRITYFFGNWRAAGTGLTLHASHVFVALDLPWTPGDLLQGQDRVHRIGQKKKVVIYYLILLNTIEEKLMVILQRSTKTLEAILNGKTSKDIDLLGSLINLMLSK